MAIVMMVIIDAFYSWIRSPSTINSHTHTQVCVRAIAVIMKN